MQLLLSSASFVVSERNDAGLVLDLVVLLSLVVAHILIELSVNVLLNDSLTMSYLQAGFGDDTFKFHWKAVNI